jgi:hypothetical protein
LRTDLSFAELVNEIWEWYKVRPVLVTETVSWLASSTRELHAVLSLDGKDRLNLRLSSLVTPQGLPEATYISLLRSTMNVRYIAGSLVYHCQELALLYSTICDTGWALRQSQPIDGDAFTFQDVSEAYYETEALITAARRTYDALRYILWKGFGSGGRGIPNNFPTTLRVCDKLPRSLRESLEGSWSCYGKQLTAYRDCIQHYVPVTSDLQHASFRRVDGNLWSVRVQLPDNPRVKSQSSFTFANNVDALTYGWELANEVITQAAQVFATIPVDTPPASMSG